MFYDHRITRLYNLSVAAVFVVAATLVLGTGERAYGQVGSNTALGGSYSAAGTVDNVTAMQTINLASGENNSAFGNNALNALDTADNNNAFGANALSAVTTADANNAFGSNALRNNVVGTGNNAFGFNALEANGPSGVNPPQASNNNAFGNSALQVNTIGSGNVAFGDSALGLNETGNESVAVGINSLRLNVFGENNTAVGANALNALGTGGTANQGNTAVGHNANASVVTVVQSTTLGAGTVAGNTGTALGYQSFASFDNSTAVGAGAETTRINQMAMGTDASTYTMPGVGSAASRAAQSGPTEFVTADANGNLSTDGGATKIIIDKNTHGIAGAFAISGIPEVLPNGTNYAVSANWGTFGGANAAALGGVARVDGDLFFNAATVLGYAPGVRAGLTYCW